MFFDICAAIIVDVHKRAVHFDSDIFKPDVCRHCAAADGNNAAASLGFFFGSVEFVRYGDFFAAVDACYLGIVDNSNFFAFEYPFVESILTMSASTPGSMLGIISITVTGFPREANNVANSMPITPPPIITKLSGSSVIESTSSEVTTFFAVNAGNRGTRRRTSVARIACRT